jgi:hypothetical protein
LHAKKSGTIVAVAPHRPIVEASLRLPDSIQADRQPPVTSA